MAFADLEVNPDVMKEYAGLSEMSLTDTELKALQHDAAMSELKSDLIYKLNIEPDDTTTLDYVYDKYTDTLQSALMYKQLELYYFKYNEGIDSGSWIWYKEFQNYYDNLKAKFGSFDKNATSTTISTIRFRRG